MELKSSHNYILNLHDLEVIEVKKYVIRPINMCEIYSSLIDEEITENDLKTIRSFETKVMRVVNKLDYMLNEEEFKNKNK